MAKAGITFEDVRKLATQLEDVEDATAYGSPAFKVRGAMLGCIAINKSAEPGSLALRIDFEQRDALLAEAPEIFYITDHYKPYPSVLVRLSKIRADQMRDLLQAAWRYVTSQKKRTPLRPQRKKGRNR